MGQVTIYLDAELEAKMREITKSMHMSQSKWIANLIKEKIEDEWPESVKQLGGAWAEFPSAEEIRGDLGEDSKREEL
jgi:predicted transcriptional regulator